MVDQQKPKSPYIWVDENASPAQIVNFEFFFNKFYCVRSIEKLKENVIEQRKKCSKEKIVIIISGQLLSSLKQSKILGQENVYKKVLVFTTKIKIKKEFRDIIYKYSTDDLQISEFAREIEQDITLQQQNFPFASSYNGQQEPKIMVEAKKKKKKKKQVSMEDLLQQFVKVQIKNQALSKQKEKTTPNPYFNNSRKLECQINQNQTSQLSFYRNNEIIVEDQSEELLEQKSSHQLMNIKQKHAVIDNQQNKELVQKEQKRKRQAKQRQQHFNSLKINSSISESLKKKQKEKEKEKEKEIEEKQKLKRSLIEKLSKLKEDYQQQKSQNMRKTRQNISCHYLVEQSKENKKKRQKFEQNIERCHEIGFKATINNKLINRQIPSLLKPKKEQFIYEEFNKVSGIWIDGYNNQHHSNKNRIEGNCTNFKMMMETDLTDRVTSTLQNNPRTLYILIHTNKLAKKVYQSHLYPFPNVAHFIIYCGDLQTAEKINREFSPVGKIYITKDPKDLELKVCQIVKNLQDKIQRRSVRSNW